MNTLSCRGTRRQTAPTPMTMIALVVTALGGLIGCSSEVRSVPAGPVITDTDQVPAEHRQGYSRFFALCSGCHGAFARGTEQGPPLLHDLYKSYHHSDRAFRRAISSGVEQHHWYFGDMPPVPAATSDDSQRIVAFLRWLQKTEGMYY